MFFRSPVPIVLCALTCVNSVYPAQAQSGPPFKDRSAIPKSTVQRAARNLSLTNLPGAGASSSPAPLRGSFQFPSPSAGSRSKTYAPVAAMPVAATPVIATISGPVRSRVSTPLIGASSDRSRKIAIGAYFFQDGKCAPGDSSAVKAWVKHVGRLPAVWLIFQGWTGWNEFPAAQAKQARELNGQLMVTWEPWNGRSGGSQWSCAAIASGSQDAYIRRYARTVRSAGVPVMLRLAHEMNGNWYPWGTAYDAKGVRHNSNTPQYFVAMWRHIVSIFRQERADNARWVWAPNITYMDAHNSLADQKRDLAALYPGDGYVDWIGLSVYNDGAQRNWNSFVDLFDTSYQIVTGISNKPLMIAEMGATEAGAPGGTSKAAWIRQTLTQDIPNRYPRVKLVNWFCRDKTTLGEANYRFDSSPTSLGAFRHAVNLPLYSGRINR